MIGSAFKFWISIISRVFTWAFNLTINENPKITLGMFLLGCAFIGLVIYLFKDSDFTLPFGGNKSDSDKKGE